MLPGVFKQRGPVRRPANVNNVVNEEIIGPMEDRGVNGTVINPYSLFTIGLKILAGDDIQQFVIVFNGQVKSWLPHFWQAYCASTIPQESDQIL